jgi:hypothetical protein
MNAPKSKLYGTRLRGNYVDTALNIVGRNAPAFEQIRERRPAPRFPGVKSTLTRRACDARALPSSRQNRRKSAHAIWDCRGHKINP